MAGNNGTDPGRPVVRPESIRGRASFPPSASAAFFWIKRVSAVAGIVVAVFGAGFGVRSFVVSQQETAADRVSEVEKKAMRRASEIASQVDRERKERRELETEFARLETTSHRNAQRLQWLINRELGDHSSNPPPPPVDAGVAP